jgi:hypothetical protein
LFSEIRRSGSDASNVSFDVDRVDGCGRCIGTLRWHIEGDTIECGGVGKGYSEGVVVVIELLSGDTIMPEGHEVVSRNGRVGSGVVPDYKLGPNTRVSELTLEGKQ